MTHDLPARFERLLEQTARRVSGGDLHPLELLQRVQSAVELAISGGRLPNEVRVVLHPADFARFEPDLEGLRAEVVTLLSDIQRRRSLQRVGALNVSFESSASAMEGMPEVIVRFVDTTHRPGRRLAGVTRRLTRQGEFQLVLPDGSTVSLSHTPFSIGRGPGNDLVLASLAVSRNHAEIAEVASGLILRDLGSRNGLVVNGIRRDSVMVTPGLIVTIGDVELRVEAARE
jgi:hypothetical protein